MPRVMLDADCVPALSQLLHLGDSSEDTVQTAGEAGEGGAN